MIAGARREHGFALTSALMILTILVVVGLAAVALADSQHGPSRDERAREAALNLAESALQSQVFRLQRATWPSASTTALPSLCSASSAATAACPDAGALAASFSAATAVDYRPGTCSPASVVSPSWATWVRDNGGGAVSYYDPSAVNAQPTFDANGDGSVWVGAQGVAGCRTRTIVELVRAAETATSFPRDTITANWFGSSNQGRKVIVDTVGAYAQPPSIRPAPKDYGAQAAPVIVRCTAPLPPEASYSCPAFTSTAKDKGQITPPVFQVASTPTPLLTPEQIDSLRARARKRGTYYTGCPPSLTGEMVFVENLTGCSYSGGNDKDAPGFLVVNNGTLTLTGNRTFYGLVYALNGQGSNGAVITMQGTSAIQGAIAVDGLGGVVAGSSGTNVVFDQRSLELVKVLGTPSPVPGTWRELPVSTTP